MQLTPLLRHTGVTVLCALASSAWAEDALYPAAQTVQSLMVEAIRAESGQAHGVLTGGVAQAITEQFKATTPIYVDVTTEKRYRQPGCSRLKVLFRQEGVQLPDDPLPRTQSIEFGINYCLDGNPPRSLE